MTAKAWLLVWAVTRFDAGYCFSGDVHQPIIAKVFFEGDCGLEKVSEAVHLVHVGQISPLEMWVIDLDMGV
jgi:hypothetical protein